MQVVVHNLCAEVGGDVALRHLAELCLRGTYSRLVAVIESETHALRVRVLCGSKAMLRTKKIWPVL